MNRQERRRARTYTSEDTAPVEIQFGRCMVEPSERPFTCYACDSEARPWPAGLEDVGYGVARITCHCGECKPIDMPLCECCFDNIDDASAAILKKFTGNPEITIENGGYFSSVEQLTRDLATDAPTDQVKH